MNLKQYKKSNQLPDFETLKYHRQVQVSKNPSNLIEFVNVNKKFTQKFENMSTRDCLTDIFLKELSETDQQQNYEYSPNEYINSLIVHRNPMFLQKKHAKIN
ncbi:unnamed protein product (macronuclear) [Paramecium tetraurelia]|uniref:Uncharacterized protein n=1 Tax=Paramecium tetraurelia TaxID=5888 RepID=A0BPC4_PARTE|nr:uncharacterized protein GSPATT00005140001 [Paramecium tetraurelia]CAK60391.1 unnamed protein product [Paramecium tetraurelia]|eukprot:XP_001427789.1 hypothetical protein (macronuclear) [Paramecium tetraurelia strain d4-2]